MSLTMDTELIISIRHLVYVTLYGYRINCINTSGTWSNTNVLFVDGVGRSTRASFAILNRGCLFRVGLFIILCVVRVPWLH